MSPWKSHRLQINWALYYLDFTTNLNVSCISEVVGDSEWLVQALPEGHVGVPTLTAQGHHGLVRQPGRRLLEQAHYGLIPPFAAQCLDQNTDKPLDYAEMIVLRIFSDSFDTSHLTWHLWEVCGKWGKECSNLRDWAMLELSLSQRDASRRFGSSGQRWDSENHICTTGSLFFRNHMHSLTTKMFI